MGLSDGGFVSHYSDVELQWSWNNRQEPNVYRTFSLILGREDIWVRYDRSGIMRATKGIKLKDGTVMDKPEWKTKPNWLHWDQNPWKEPNFVRVQGLLALTDSNNETGGFHCVPGFTSRFFDWQKENKSKEKRGGLVNVPEGDPIRGEIQIISLRKRSLLIWDSRLPHGNFPNNNDQMRIVQYVTFFPSLENDKQEAKKRQNSFYVQTSQVSPVKLTELGEKILGTRMFSNNELIPFDW